MRDDRAADDQREHDQRVSAATCVDAIRQLEQVDRHREKKDVDEELENACGQDVAPANRETLSKDVAEVAVYALLNDRR